MANEEFIKITEQEVRELFRKYVTPDRYSAFINMNDLAIKNIVKGNISDVLTLNNNINGTEYRARIHGIKRVTTGQNSYLKFNCLYANKALNISNKLTIGDGVCILNQQQQDILRREGRLDETLKFQSPDGSIKERYVAVDRELNRLSFVNKSAFRCPQKLLGTELTPEQQQSLSNGEKASFEIENQPKTVWFDPTENTIRIDNGRLIAEPMNVPEKSILLKEIEQSLTTNKSDRSINKQPTLHLK